MKNLSTAMFLMSLIACQSGVPDGFVDLHEVAPDIIISLRYNTNDNFIGSKIDGYYAHKCYITKEAAAALKNVQDELSPRGLSLKVFDAYRPQRAVDHFVRWAQDLSDSINKASYYPQVPKSELFDRGYIARRSGHTRGSTVDLTLVYAEEGQELDMGTPWDFFSEKSWPGSKEVLPAQKEHRMILREVMVKHGFKPYEKEWWHFTLENEPFPEAYFNFPVR